MSPALRKPATPDPSISVWVHGRAVEVPAGQWPEGQMPRALLRFAGPVPPQPGQLARLLAGMGLA